MFQSLLSWIQLLGGVVGLEHRSVLVVSILIVLDSAPGPQANAIWWGYQQGFQSLLSWIQLLGANAQADQPTAPPGVSILIVLDSAPGH